MKSKFFSVYFYGEPFGLFSTIHIISLVTIFIMSVLLYVFSDKFKNDTTDKLFRHALAYILIVTECSFQFWCAYNHVWTAEYNLPFHLCSAATVICIVMLFKKSFKIYQLAYYWGLAGAMFALITPDLSGYNYPHYVFFKYFILHGFIILSVLYMTFVHKYFLSFKSVLNAFIITNVFAAIVAPIDFITGGNYLFLCRKPNVFTLLNYFGLWPWYIIPMEILVFSVFIILYIPFSLRKDIKEWENL